MTANEQSWNGYTPTTLIETPFLVLAFSAALATSKYQSVQPQAVGRDQRGRIYRVYDYKAKAVYRMQNSEHGCGVRDESACTLSLLGRALAVELEHVDESHSMLSTSTSSSSSKRARTRVRIAPK